VTLSNFASGFNKYWKAKMTTNSILPLLQVLDQDGSVMLAQISGSDTTVAILDDKVLDLLYAQCRNAKAEAVKSDIDKNAALELCATLDGILKSYRKIKHDYTDRIEIERERAEAEQSLQEASNAINASRSSQS
jgi:hypothetical protein